MCWVPLPLLFFVVIVVVIVVGICSGGCDGHGGCGGNGAMSSGRHGMVMVERKRCLAQFVPNVPLFGIDGNGDMYPLIYRLRNVLVVQWAGSLKMFPWSWVQFLMLPFCLL